MIAEYVEQTSATMPKWSKSYIYIGGRLLATEAPNGSGEIVHYHHPDRLSTKLVTNNLDTTSFHQANLPFGTALETESTGATNRRFTSYDRSTTTGLDYAINRQYDSRQGRFTQVDPLGMAAASLADPQTLNMYSYVGNDPVNRVDPDGQFWGALFRFIGGLFTSLKPNVINGSFSYRNVPPVSVSFTPNFQNIGVGFAGIGFSVRSNGHWLPAVLGSRESLDPQDLSEISEAQSEADKLVGKSNCTKFIEDLALKALVRLNNGQPLDPDTLAWAKTNMTAASLLTKIKNAKVVLLPDQEGPDEAAANALESTQTITFYKGFFFYKYHSDIVVNRPSGPEWIRRTLTQRGQSLIHEGLHLLIGGFTDELLGEVISGKRAKGSEAARRKWGSKIINAAVQSDCK